MGSFCPYCEKPDPCGCQMPAEDVGRDWERDCLAAERSIEGLLEQIKIISDRHVQYEREQAIKYKTLWECFTEMCSSSRH